MLCFSSVNFLAMCTIDIAILILFLCSECFVELFIGCDSFNWENLQTFKIELKIWPLSFLGAKRAVLCSYLWPLIHVHIPGKKEESKVSWWMGYKASLRSGGQEEETCFVVLSKNVLCMLRSTLLFSLTVSYYCKFTVSNLSDKKNGS